MDCHSTDVSLTPSGTDGLPRNSGAQAGLMIPRNERQERADCHSIPSCLPAFGCFAMTVVITKHRTICLVFSYTIFNSY
jgi:hypothetical protein